MSGGKAGIFLATGLALLSLCPCLAWQALAQGNEEELSWFRVAVARWESESAARSAQGKPERGHHDRSLFIEFLSRWPNSEFADQAHLLLLEDSFCVTWAGYPDCGLLEAAAYNRLLKKFPGGSMREEIELRRAAVYYEMARLWLKGEGAHSERWSDLCRAQSLEAALKLKSSSNPATSDAATRLEQKLTREFDRPMAPVPAQIPDPGYN